MIVGLLIAEETLVNLESFGELAPPVQVALFLGSLSFITAALISMTAFTRIIIVISFVRRALSTQEIPPNQVMIGLSMFLTLFVMAPTFETIYEKGVVPYMSMEPEASNEIKTQRLYDLVTVASTEVKSFMILHTRKEELALFVDLSNGDAPVMSEDSESSVLYNPDSIDLKVLIPAFVISELKTAFIMGFCIYIPFLLIDLVVSTVLMSLGMMMMPPVIVSTPCKLLLFVLVDGWQLISTALVNSFGG